MGFSAGIALIAGASGVLTAIFNAEKINDVQAEKAAVTSEFKEFRREAARAIDVYRTRALKAQEAAESLAIVLKSKEAAELERPSPRIKTHIDLLKGFIEKMDEPEPPLPRPELRIAPDRSP